MTAATDITHAGLIAHEAADRVRSAAGQVADASRALALTTESLGWERQRWAEALDELRRLSGELTAGFAELADAGGWIIGNADRTQWRRWGEAGLEWTSDRETALRFARRSDAEAVAADDEDAWRIVRYLPDAALPFAAPTLTTGDELREARDKEGVGPAQPAQETGE